MLSCGGRTHHCFPPGDEGHGWRCVRLRLQRRCRHFICELKGNALAFCFQARQSPALRKPFTSTSLMSMLWGDRENSFLRIKTPQFCMHGLWHPLQFKLMNQSFEVTANPFLPPYKFLRWVIIESPPPFPPEKLWQTIGTILPNCVFPFPSPIHVCPLKQQKRKKRESLKWVIANAYSEMSFQESPERLS